MNKTWLPAVCALNLAAAMAGAQAPASAPGTSKDPLAGMIAPAEWLRKQPRPSFKAGHALPPLTRYGWCLGVEARIEFAEHWGYCLEFGGGYLNQAVVDRVLGNTNDPDAKIIALAAKDPKTYKLAVITSRELPAKDKAPPEVWCRDADGRLLNGQVKSQDGNAWTPGVETILSPAAPDSFWEESGRLQAAPLKRLNAAAPIAVILNGGEYGLACAGWGRKIWEKDPAIVKAKGDRSWADYANERAGRSQKLVADIIRKAVPQAEYIYYCAGGAATRNLYGWWNEWSGTYEHSRGTCTLPTAQMYYRDFNDGWLGKSDALSLVLNARAQEIRGGEPLAYYWLCGGYKEPKPGNLVSDIPRYMGFLRCAYTAGMIGGNAGYYTYPRYPSPPYPGNTGGFDVKFPPTEPPNWLEQMVALSRVHAQFSHLEIYLRQGDLVAGPYVNTWSTDLPAYELLPAELSGQAETKYLTRVEQQDATGWEKADFDDAGWTAIELPQREPKIFEGVAGLQEPEGVVWFRKTVAIPPSLAGKDLVLNLASCDDNDVTYWNGEKIGQTQCWGAPRKYKIPADKVKAGQAVIAVRVEDWWGGGGIAIVPGKAEELSLAVADGSNSVSLAGPWKHAIARVVLADKSKKPEYSRLLPGRPVRVLARKLKAKPQWLITVWAADGQDRDIRVPVPDLGEVALKATADANLYEAALKDGKPTVKAAGIPQ